MRISLTSRHHFEAAHRLENPERDAAWNREVFDKCNNEHGHGHTYRLEVTVEGPIDPESGYLVDFRELKNVVEKRLIRSVERRHLNFDVEFLRGVNPTAENIAVAFWKELDGRIPGARLKRITLHETQKNSVVFEG